MKRQINIEFLRIIAMFLIVACHFIIHSDLLANSNVWSLNHIIILLVVLFLINSANCYMLIGGYFLVKSKFKLEKLLSMWSQVQFYSIFIYLILVVTGITSFSLKELIFSFLPIYRDQYWFFTCYFGVYMLLPLLNLITNNIDKNQYQKILIIGLLILSLIPSFLYFTDIFDINYGYSLLWFIYIYFVGGYLRLHYKTQKSFKHYFGIYLIVTLVSFIANLLAVELLSTIINKKITSYLLMNYNSITVFISSICFFLAFTKINLKSDIVKKSITILSPLTFGVYLIHDNNYIRKYLWIDLVNAVKYANSYKLWVLFISCVPLIYVVCSVIELLRQKFFKILQVDKFIRKLTTKIISSYEVISKKIYL